MPSLRISAMREGIWAAGMLIAPGMWPSAKNLRRAHVDDHGLAAVAPGERLAERHGCGRRPGAFGPDHAPAREGREQNEAAHQPSLHRVIVTRMGRPESVR